MTIGSDMHGLRVAIPYLRRYQGGTFVIKLSGSLCRPGAALANICEQVALLHQLGIHVILVHGGGMQADKLANQLGHTQQRVAGRRVTDATTLGIIQQAFGAVNTDLLSHLRAAQVPSVGLSGVDAGLVTAHKRPLTSVTDPSTGETSEIDFGFVGDIDHVNADVIRRMHAGGFLPVVASLAADENGQVLNVNADTIAGHIAAGVGAQKLFILSDVDGVFREQADPSSLCSQLTMTEAEQLEQDGSIAGGMLPKMAAIRMALENGVPRAHVINGAQPDSLLVEVFTNEGCGTLLLLGESNDQTPLQTQGEVSG